MRRDLTFVDLTKKILNLAISFENGYNKKFVTTRMVDFVKDITGSDFLTGTRAQYY